jgi:superfamily I DNA and/or RNA helicase
VKLLVKEIKFTQNNVSDRFTDGTLLAELSQQLITKQTSLAAIPPIRVVNFRGTWWTLDNRRLRVFNNAFVNEIEVVVCDLKDPAIAREFHSKRTNKSLDSGGEVRLTRATASNDQHFEQGAFVFTRKVLNWTVEQIQNKSLVISQDDEPLEKQWFGANRYYQSFLPLILEEARAIIHAGLEAVETDKKPLLELNIKTKKFSNNPENPSVLTFERKINSNEIQFKPSDVLLLRSATKKEICFIAFVGYLKTEDVKRIQVKAVVDQFFYIVDSDLFEDGAEWNATLLGSVVTQLRMYEVCTLVPQPPFLTEIYEGELEKTTQDDGASNSFSSSMEYVTSQLSNLATANAWDDEELIEQTNDTRLNASQEKAIKQFLQIEQGIQLVQGPPGTGKTTTIVELLKRLVQRGERVLVCAPSNKAVQLLAERFVEKNPATPVALAGVEDKLPEDKRLQQIFIHTWGKTLNEEITDIHSRLWELVPEKINQENVSSPIRLLQQIEADFLNTLHRINFHQLNIIKNPVQEQADFQLASEKYQRLLILYQSNGVDLETFVQQGKSLLSQMERILNNLQINLLRCMDDDAEQGLEGQLLNQAKIVFSTLSVAGRSQLRKMNSVTTLIVDEAGQAVEAETLIPFAALPKKCLLIGDTKQLPATVISTKAEQLNFGRSMLWRLLEDCQQPYSLLTIQYRMHPSIRHWPSERFYAGKMIDHESIVSGSRQLSGIATADAYLHPYAMIDVNGREEKRGNSFVNLQEAETISLLLMQLQQQYQIDVVARVGIITFYKGQADLLNQRLQTKYRGIKIQTVDGFQGGECDFIIISFVRSNPQGTVGFLKDFRRLNVALTRARFSLIMVGNAVTLAEKDETLADLITHLKEQKKIFSAERVRSQSQMPDQSSYGSNSSNWRSSSSALPSSSSSSSNWRSTSSDAASADADSRQRSSSRKTPCRFFNGKPNSCRAGLDCTFSHEQGGLRR